MAKSPRYTPEHAAAGLDAKFPEIEIWPNQFPGYEIVVDDPEFTSVCPKTGLPYFGVLAIRYMPDKSCLELKSLKEYLQSYRNLGIFQENVVNQVLEDVVKWAKPVWAEVRGEFRPRGGISTTIVAKWPRPKGGQGCPHAKLARRVPQPDLQPRTALLVLTALNLLNYADRNVLFAVQPLVQDEFHLTNAQIGYLTSAFLGFYMIAAPFVGPLADRYSRKLIIVLGAVFWSGLTLLTAVTHTYTELLIRHTLVGVGEATFVTIAPTFVADSFPENKRGRIFGIFYLAIPVGTAAGYLLRGELGPKMGWRFPFYVAAVPGFLLALAVWFLPEPPRGQFDSQKETPERGTLRGLARNPAFWAVTLGMAAGTFSLGGIQVWMPTFLSRARGYSLESANLIFGAIVVVDGILASLAGGWL